MNLKELQRIQICDDELAWITLNYNTTTVNYNSFALFNMHLKKLQRITMRYNALQEITRNNSELHCIVLNHSESHWIKMNYSELN